MLRSLRSTMHEPVCIPVYFDFASTISYFTHRVMQRLATELDNGGIVLDWSPIDLTVITGWKRGAAFDDPRRSNVQRLSQELSISVQPPSHWMDSRSALTSHLLLTDGHDRGRWREAVWKWVYEDSHSLDEASSLAAISTAAGLHPPDPTRRDLHQLERRSLDARNLGVVGVPTFLLGSYPLGIGIQDDRTMLTFLRRFAEKNRHTSPPN